MLDRLKRFAQRMFQMGDDAPELMQKRATRREAAFLDYVQLSVKRKLGSSWFRKALSFRSRRARLKTLTPVERFVAKQMGWMR